MVSHPLSTFQSHLSSTHSLIKRRSHPKLSDPILAVQPLSYVRSSLDKCHSLAGSRTSLESHRSILSNQNSLGLDRKILPTRLYDIKEIISFSSYVLTRGISRSLSYLRILSALTVHSHPLRIHSFIIVHSARNVFTSVVSSAPTISNPLKSARPLFRLRIHTTGYRSLRSILIRL